MVSMTEQSRFQYKHVLTAGGGVGNELKFHAFVTLATVGCEWEDCMLWPHYFSMHWRTWLRRYATSRKVAGSNPD